MARYDSHALVSYGVLIARGEGGVAIRVNSLSELLD
jgi:hypothetical protein